MSPRALRCPRALPRVWHYIHCVGSGAVGFVCVVVFVSGYDEEASVVVPLLSVALLVTAIASVTSLVPLFLRHRWMRFFLIGGLALNALLGSAISGVYLFLQKQRAAQPDVVCAGESIELASTVLIFVAVVAWFVYLVVAASVARRNYLYRPVNDMAQQGLMSGEADASTGVNAIHSTDEARARGLMLDGPEFHREPPTNAHFSLEDDDDRHSSERNGDGGDSSSGNAA